MTSRSGLTRGLLAVTITMILVATLFPVPGPEPATLSRCLICGARGVADAILNVGLFLPLGVALALRGWPGWRAALAAALLSLGIEIAQMFIPGRDPSWGDLAFNTLGGGVGYLAVRYLPVSLRLAPPRQASLQLAAVAGAAGMLVVTGVLFRPAFPATPYYGQWAVDLGPAPWYRFDVLAASVGGATIPPGPVPHSARVRDVLLRHPRLDIRAVALPPVPRSRRVVSIYFDPALRHIVWLGSAGDDLLLRYRAGAAALRLDQPAFRFPGVLRGIRPGDSVHITLSGEWRRPCVAVNGSRACGDGLTLGRGWNLLLSLAGLPGWLRALAGAGWIFALFLPAGLWARDGRRAALAGIVLIPALLLLPLPLDLLPTPPSELLAGGLGIFAGFAIRRASGG